MTETQPVVTPVALPEFPRNAGTASAVRSVSSLADVKLTASVIAGRTTMTLAQVRNLEPGDVVRLDRAPDATVDILVNGRRAAIGDVIVIDDHLAARINEIVEAPGD